MFASYEIFLFNIMKTQTCIFFQNDKKANHAGSYLLQYILQYI